MGEPSSSGPSALSSDSWHDQATGLPGPAFWRTVLASESARDLRYERFATVVLVELGGLDLLAADWGADVADQLVIAIARVLRAGSRTSDYVARISFDRFGLILTETDEIAAINFVERIRERCARHVGRAARPLAVFFGWASSGHGLSLTDAASRADERLGRERGRPDPSARDQGDSDGAIS